MIQVTVKPRTRAGSWETFERRYAPIKTADQTPMHENWDAECDAADGRCIWTVVDADGTLYVCPGAAVVNRIGYILTEKAWSDVEFSNPGYVY